MLELRDVSLSAARAGGEALLLRNITAHFPPGQLCAIVGPSGCGKSTLLKVIAGVRQPSSGSVHWEGRDLEQHDLAPHEIGYVPQFSIAYELLTVRESIDAALQLRVGGLTNEQRSARRDHLLGEVGLLEIASRRVRVLSGGQKRRLALALEMVTGPLLLLADEVTSGLDPKSETEVVQLLHAIARQEGRTVLSVTHSLRHLELHDSIAVLAEGQLAYHGSPELLPHYFGTDSLDALFATLATRTGEEWHQLWTDHAANYFPSSNSPAPAETADAARTHHAPGFVAQFLTLLRRRWKLFLRDRGQVALQLALLFGFPFLVVIFAWEGLPQIQNLASDPADALQQLIDAAEFSLQSGRIATLVSGLVMFQVVLLTLMGSNNAAREIAGERDIFEKEKFAGLQPASYIASKAVFLAALVAAQSVWMAVFVNLICRFPGELLAQIAILTLTNAAMTAVCLAISAFARSAENASLISVYLVGFQLPLSGAVLALPEVIGAVTRPFIAAYWGWSGYLQTMRDTRFYDVVQTMSQTELAAFALCAFVLIMHVVAGVFVAYVGTQNSRWH
jgi:ABC transport system ATP-binding/permease protein